MSKKKSKIASYEAAMAELQEIVRQLQDEEIGIDQLAEQVKRAAQLIQFCKEKLRSTGQELEGLFDEL